MGARASCAECGGATTVYSAAEPTLVTQQAGDEPIVSTRATSSTSTPTEKAVEHVALDLPAAAPDLELTTHPDMDEASMGTTSVAEAACGADPPDSTFDSAVTPPTTASSSDAAATAAVSTQVGEAKHQPPATKTLKKGAGRAASGHVGSPKGKSSKKTPSSVNMQSQQARPFDSLLKAMEKNEKYPEAEKAAAWIGSCAQNPLKADPQLAGAVSGCQCPGLNRSPESQQHSPRKRSKEVSRQTSRSSSKTQPSPRVSEVEQPRKLPPRRLSLSLSSTNLGSPEQVAESDTSPMNKTAEGNSAADGTSPKAKLQQLTPEQKEHMERKAKKLDNIGRSLEECNQQ